MVWVNGKNINVVHNARYEGSVKIQPIGEAMQYPKHAKLHGLKDQLKKTYFYRLRHLNSLVLVI